MVGAELLPYRPIEQLYLRVVKLPDLYRALIWLDNGLGNRISMQHRKTDGRAAGLQKGSARGLHRHTIQYPKKRNDRSLTHPQWTRMRRFPVSPAHFMRLVVLVVAAPRDPGLITALGGAIEPLVHAPEAIQSARISGVGVIHDAVLASRRYLYSMPPSRCCSWLEAAPATLEEHGDGLNAAHARYLEIRRLLLIGHLDEAERLLAELDPTPFPASRTAHEPRGRGHRDAAPPDESRALHSLEPSAPRNMHVSLS